MTSSLEKGWFLPSGHRPLDLWNQTGYRKREGRRGEIFFFTVVALVKARNFKKYLQNPTPRLLLSWVHFSLNIHVFPRMVVRGFGISGWTDTIWLTTWADFLRSFPCQLCCFPESAAKWEVQSLTEDVSYLEPALDKDISCTALLPDVERGRVGMVSGQGN